MLASRFSLVLAVTGLAAIAIPCLTQSAWAQTATTDEEVVTTSHATALPSQAQTDTAKPAITQQQLDDWVAKLGGGDPLPRSDDPLRLTNTGQDTSALRQIHGMAEVSMGSGGYRSAYVSTQIPVGKDGTLGIAVSQTDLGKYGYSGYGYGRSGYGNGYGRGFARGGTVQSVAVSLDLGGGDKPAPAGCAPGFRDGDRYIEPLWVTRLHGYQSCDTTTTTTESQ